MSAPEDFKRVGDLLGEVFDVAAAQDISGPTSSDAGPDAAHEAPALRPNERAAPRSPASLARTLALAWADVVGEEVAENASPMQLKNGTLVVSTSSSVWADTLSYMGADLAERLNERLGQHAVQQILFRHAGWEQRSGSGRVRPGG